MAKLWTLLTGSGSKAFVEPPFWQSGTGSVPFLSSSLQGDRERIDHDFESYISGAYKASGVVFACIQTRQLVFSEARFQWRSLVAGRPGDLFGSPELALLESPWPGGTTGELLARMDVTASLAGSYYGTVADDRGRFGKAATGPGRRIVHMPPQRVSIVIHAASGNPHDLDARVAGYMYEPLGSPESPVLLMPDEVCHYSPIPDPDARFRGMSWLTPIITEIQADKAAMRHKLKFFENGATPQMVMSLPESMKHETFKQFVQTMNASHQGVDNAYKTLFVGGGADPKIVGADLKQLDFKSTQGHGETRIAAAAGVPPVIVGLSEGLQSATYSNYAQARRRFADGTIRPLWRMAAASLQNLVAPPRPGASLWYDDRDIPFLREDRKDVAEIQAQQAQTIRNLVDAGYTPDSAVAAVTSEDWSALQHSGLYSVQLQEPGTQDSGDTPTDPPPPGDDPTADAPPTEEP